MLFKADVFLPIHTPDIRDVWDELIKQSCCENGMKCMKSAFDTFVYLCNS